MPDALVIGGTGPTGPHLLGGLLERGYEVTIFHRGTHEPEDLPEVRHLHGDPHFRETIDDALGTEEYDVVVAMYGRTRLLAETLRGRCGHLLSVGGPPVYAGYFEPQLMHPFGLPVPVLEDSAPLVDSSGPAADLPGLRFAHLMLETERTVQALHERATCFRYPVIYGPRNPVPWPWSVIRRVLDRRPYVVLPDGGLAIHTRCAARNAAEFLLLAVDHPEAAAGQTYNVGDEEQWTLRQWVELIAAALGASIDVVSIPSEVAPALAAVWAPLATPISPHSILSIEKARAQLGYRDVVAPRDALAALVEALVDDPPDLQSCPAFLDRFDYGLEDALVAAYRRACEQIRLDVPQEAPEVVHGMPHPTRPGAVDQRGR